MAKRGRPHIPYRTAQGKYIDGLARRKDGRWHILATGKLFTEHDEQRAIDRFRATCPAETVFIPISRSIDPADNAEAADKTTDITEQLVQIDYEDGTNEVGYHLDISRRGTITSPTICACVFRARPPTHPKSVW